jgi:hypothetical protein
MSTVEPRYTVLILDPRNEPVSSYGEFGTREEAKAWVDEREKWQAKSGFAMRILTLWPVGGWGPDKD